MKNPAWPLYRPSGHSVATSTLLADDGEAEAGLGRRCNAGRSDPDDLNRRERAKIRVLGDDGRVVLQRCRRDPRVVAG